MTRRYWLMKSEASAYSIDDLKKDKSTLWDGVRNYQARNLMREMTVGDQALFYHSNADPSAVVGIHEVSGPAEPDPTQFDSSDSHYDPKATPASPIWYGVRVKFKKKFARVVTLPEIREHKALKNMVLLKRSRLSVQPVTEKEFNIISELGSRKAESARKTKT
jgi:predicted RNA-binding protein with PUA-like domain